MPECEHCDGTGFTNYGNSSDPMTVRCHCSVSEEYAPSPEALNSRQAERAAISAPTSFLGTLLWCRILRRHDWSVWEKDLADHCFASRQCKRCGVQASRIGHWWSDWEPAGANDIRTCAACQSQQTRSSEPRYSPAECPVCKDHEPVGYWSVTGGWDHRCSGCGRHLE